MPDNTLTMDLNGTTCTIHEHFGGKDTLSDLIAKRAASNAQGGSISYPPPQAPAQGTPHSAPGKTAPA